MKIYGVAIVGYGGMGSYHAKEIPHTKQMVLKGVYDLRHERNQLAEKNQIHAYQSLDDLLSDEAVDIVIIATPNDTHADIAIQSFYRGKHVICEKPVTLSLSTFDQMLNCAKTYQKELIVHQSRRWDNDYITAKEIIDQKLIGHVFHIESRVHGGNGIPGDWRCIKKHGGGMLYDWGVHLIDQLYLIKKLPIIDIQVHFSKVLGYEVDDGFKLWIKFEDQSTALVEVETTNFIKLPRWYIKGTHGTALIEDFQVNGYMNLLNVPLSETIHQPVKAGNGFTKTMAPPRDDALTKVNLPVHDVIPYAFYDHVTAYLDGKEPLFIQNSEVRKVLETIENALKSF